MVRHDANVSSWWISWTVICHIPSNDRHPSCIYSTLKCVSSQAGKYNVTPGLTFDQPSYWKAPTKIRSQPTDNALKDVVLRLGGFHMEMSFLGSIGNLMAGSWLQEVLQVVYASNTVNHMLSDKAVSRALRGHLLVDAALHTILLADAYNVPLPLEDDWNKPEEETTSKGSHDDVNSVEMQVTGDTVVTDLTEAKLLYGRIVASYSTVSVEESCSSDVFEKLQSTLNEKKNSINTRTGLLWVQYLEMVDILLASMIGKTVEEFHFHKADQAVILGSRSTVKVKGEPVKVDPQLIFPTSSYWRTWWSSTFTLQIRTL